jgi:hypothetical protein
MPVETPAAPGLEDSATEKSDASIENLADSAPDKGELKIADDAAVEQGSPSDETAGKENAEE